MHGKLFVVFSLICLCFYLYGIFFTITDLHENKNKCQMTYMFEFPTFTKVNFEGNDKFPKYNLYAYSEGHLTENARNMVFNGAPVLFIPGNAGSYKQVRSLASVALRKGIDNNQWPHLDYFAVDLKEEYSGLYGGILQEQTRYIERCVTAILNLYRNLPNRPKKVVLVGHSIGGKIAQSLLTSENTTHLINTVITLATPMDKAVLALDYETYRYYRDVNQFWMENRNFKNIADNTTNNCVSKNKPLERIRYEEKKKLDDKLLISVGGGSRDLLVPSALTHSIYSDIVVMTDDINDVWLSTDHNCILWCLQLMKIVNRFLYSIIDSPRHRNMIFKGQPFIDDKFIRLQKAKYYFESKYIARRKEAINFENAESYDWIEDSRRVFSLEFPEGINQTRVQMIRLSENVLYKMMKVDVANLETDDWVFGCSSSEVTGSFRYCSKATSLSHYSKRVPSSHHEKPDRTTLSIDLHLLKQENPTWTHVLLRFLPTREPFNINVDVHNSDDRELKVMMPKWYSFSSVNVLYETVFGTLSYKLKLSGLDDVHEAVELYLTPKKCTKESHQTLAQICVPWSNGFNRYHSFTEENDKKPMYIYTDKKTPSGYNTTINSISVDLLLDPNCRYSITIKNSFGMTLSRIFKNFYSWLPAHLICIILLAFKHQISLTPKDEDFLCGSFRKSLGQCTPFFIITASRVFVKFILFLKFLPNPEAYDSSLMVSVIIHGSALALLMLMTAGVWIGITLCSNIAHRVLMRLVKFKIPQMSDVLMNLFEKFPFSVMVLLVAIGVSSCGAVALLLASILYFLFISKQYEDYMEEFVYKTASLIAKKLFGKLFKPKEPKKTKRRNPNYRDMLTKSILENMTEEERNADEELNKLLEEQLEKQQKEQEENEKKEKLARIEYDAITEGLSGVNFHMPLFLMASILSILNLPSMITWAKNYDYAIHMNPDPTLIPSLMIIIPMGFLWQFAPRNLLHYNILSSVCYIFAVVCVLYCQDSSTVFRLNYVVGLVYIIVTLHQIFGRKPKEPFDFGNMETEFLEKNGALRKSNLEIEENKEVEEEIKGDEEEAVKEEEKEIINSDAEKVAEADSDEENEEKSEDEEREEDDEDKEEEKRKEEIKSKKEDTKHKHRRTKNKKKNK